MTIDVGGRRYDVSCRDGEEEQLRDLARLVDDKAQRARAAVGGMNEARQLLLAALLLADEISDLRRGHLPPDADVALAGVVEQLAGRVETLADHLENGVRSA